jgi:hypothetical protein
VLVPDVDGEGFAELEVDVPEASSVLTIAEVMVAAVVETPLLDVASDSTAACPPLTLPANNDSMGRLGGTALSKHVWSLKDSQTQYKITWKILAHVKSYSPISKRCNLCTTEKYYIICHPNLSTLNNRNELASSCRHRRKFLLRHASIT